MAIHHQHQQLVPHTSVFQAYLRDYDPTEQCSITHDNLNEMRHIVGTISSADGYTVGPPFFNLPALIRWGNTHFLTPTHPLTGEYLDYTRFEPIRWSFPRRDGIKQTEFRETERMLREAIENQFILRNHRPITNNNQPTTNLNPTDFHPNLFDENVEQLMLDAPYHVDPSELVDFRREMSEMTQNWEGPDWIVEFWVYHPYNEDDERNNVPIPNELYTAIDWSFDENWGDFRRKMAISYSRSNPLVVRYWHVYPLHYDMSRPDSDETMRLLEDKQQHS